MLTLKQGKINCKNIEKNKFSIHVDALFPEPTYAGIMDEIDRSRTQLTD